MFLPVGSVFLEFTYAGSPRRAYYTIKSVAEAVALTETDLNEYITANNLTTSVQLTGVRKEVMLKWYLSLTATSALARSILSSHLDLDLDERAAAIG